MLKLRVGKKYVSGGLVTSKDTLYNDTATTPMLRQYLGIKADFPDAVLMFRLGDFYEMFFDDAVLASKVLDITLTSRNRNDPNPVPLCGVPYHSVEPYIAKLLSTGQKVAICDQVEDPKFAKGVVKREVTRVVTPGVIAEGAGLNASSHNFLAAVASLDGAFGVAIADVSTGFFQAGSLPTREVCFEDLTRMEPREIILPRHLAGDAKFTERLKQNIPGVVFTVLDDSRFDTVSLAELHGAKELISRFPVAAQAAAAAFSYISSTQKVALPHIQSISIMAGERVMRLDEATKRNLELVCTMHDGTRQGSLIEAMDRTSTAMGARKLKRWLLSPLLDPDEINSRLLAVDSIVSEPKLLRALPDTLGKMHDLERIVSRAAMGLANARDLVSLCASLDAVAELKTALEGSHGLLAFIRDSIDPHKKIISSILATIVDEPPLSLKDGGLIKSGVSAELDELKNIIAHGKDFIAGLEAKEKERTGIGSLKIRYNRVFGYYLEVTNTHLNKVPEDYIRKQTLSNAERFITPELKEYEEKILGAEEKSRQLEFEIFENVRREVGTSSRSLLATADALATLDSIVSLARVAAEFGYTKPVVDLESVIDIREGRHPIIERLNPIDRFIPNDVFLDDGEQRFMMITGPNMAGKSTVMRQSALIVLMAQIGSFVPAASAKIGIVDRIFTRVGAHDALAKGQSTFMVEMSEAALILKEATERSLVIIDEIGRGTSTFDGLAIAWAVAEDLCDRVRARVLFATHYHELTELALTKQGIKNMHIAVKEWNGEIIFLRRLLSGTTSRSYGIAVAKLAGLPSSVIERAGEVLVNLESAELDEVGKPRIAHHHDGCAENTPAQFNLFTQPTPGEISSRLAELDTSKITPLEALNILHELKGKL